MCCLESFIIRIQVIIVQSVNDLQMFFEENIYELYKEQTVVFAVEIRIAHNDVQFKFSVKIKTLKS